MHKFVAKLCSYKKPKNYQRMPKINVYSTFVSYSWILYQCYMRKKTKQTNEKVKSESLMLSSREPNKLKSSSHQQEYSKDNAVKKKKDKKKERNKIARKLYASYSFKPAKYAPAYNGT